MPNRYAKRRNTLYSRIFKCAFSFFSIIHLVCIVASIYILQRYVSRAFDLRNLRETHEKMAVLRGCAEEGVIVRCLTAEEAVPMLQNDAIPCGRKEARAIVAVRSSVRAS